MLPWRIQTHARELVGKYLAWHYNHGAKVVGINVGTSDQSLMSHLSEGAFGQEALAAYSKFLGGKKIIEK
jgi:hypothetical protein